jgi:hypothetical protein
MPRETRGAFTHFARDATPLEVHSDLTFAARKARDLDGLVDFLGAVGTLVSDPPSCFGAAVTATIDVDGTGCHVQLSAHTNGVSYPLFLPMRVDCPMPLVEVVCARLLPELREIDVEPGDRSLIVRRRLPTTIRVPGAEPAGDATRRLRRPGR